MVRMFYLVLSDFQIAHPHVRELCDEDNLFVDTVDHCHGHGNFQDDFL